MGYHRPMAVYTEGLYTFERVGTLWIARDANGEPIARFRRDVAPETRGYLETLNRFEAKGRPRSLARELIRYIERRRRGPIWVSLSHWEAIAKAAGRKGGPEIDMAVKRRLRPPKRTEAQKLRLAAMRKKLAERKAAARKKVAEKKRAAAAKKRAAAAAKTAAAAKKKATVKKRAAAARKKVPAAKKKVAAAKKKAAVSLRRRGRTTL